MSRITRIAILIPNLGRGGAQQVFRNQVRFLGQHFAVTPVVFNTLGMSSEDVRLRPLSLEVPAGKNIVGKVYNFFARIRRFRKFKKQHKIDLCISHLEGADYVNVLSGITKTILWVHGSKTHDQNIDKSIGWLRKQILIPLVYRRATKIVTVSGGLTRELTGDFSIPEDKVVSIPNGMPIESVQKSFEAPLPPGHALIYDGYFTIITHCRFAKQKNLHSLLELVLALKERRDIRWIILGDGELRDSLLHFCNVRGITIYNPWQNMKPTYREQVYFLGYSENPYVYLQRSDLYVMTSAWEGYPLSLIEALICEVPIISTDCFTGPAEIIGSRERSPVDQYPYYGTCGVLMPLINGENDHENIALWKKEILHLRENKPLLKQFRTAARSRRGEFSDVALNEQLLSLISKI